MGRKACKILPGIRMRLCVNFKDNACRNMGIMPGHTDRQTDELFLRCNINEHEYGWHFTAGNETYK